MLETNFRIIQCHNDDMTFMSYNLRSDSCSIYEDRAFFKQWHAEYANIGFGEKITHIVSIEVNFTHLILCSWKFCTFSESRLPRHSSYRNVWNVKSWTTEVHTKGETPQCWDTHHKEASQCWDTHHREASQCWDTHHTDASQCVNYCDSFWLLHLLLPVNMQGPLWGIVTHGTWAVI